MKTQKIIVILWVTAVLAGCAQSGSVGTMSDNRVTQSKSPALSKGSTFMNGLVKVDNGASLVNGKSPALALMNLASRPLGKKN